MGWVTVEKQVGPLLALQPGCSHRTHEVTSLEGPLAAIPGCSPFLLLHQSSQSAPPLHTQGN